MARTVTLVELRTWARQLAGVEGDPNITDAELTVLANRHLTEVYDALVDAGPPEYYASTSAPITIVAGTSLYPLSADFRTLLEVYVSETSTENRLIHPMGNGQLGRYRAPTAAGTFFYEYIPTPSPLVADGDTFDGVSGWEELIANLMARDVMIKRDQDTSDVRANIGALQGRIAVRSRSRDRGHPRYTSDLDEQSETYPYSTTSRVTAYRLRAGNLELYEAFWGLP